MNRKIKLIFFLLVLITGTIIGADHYLIPLENKLTKKDTRIAQMAALTWLRIEKTKNTCPDLYDYFPHGGMRIFYCHIADIVAYRDFVNMLDIDIFLTGPHTKEKLELDTPYQFGHYNPAFVRHIKRVAIPLTKNPFFKKEFQKVYDQTLAPLARIFYITYAKLHTNPSLKNRLIDDYQKFLSKKEGKYYNYDRFFSFMSSQDFPETPPSNITTFALKKDYEGGYSGNVVKTAVAFWLRRSMDKTDHLFFSGLKELMKNYDADFISRYRI